MIRKKIFLDTSICIDVARGIIPCADWLEVLRRMRGIFRYYISPLTVYELVAGLAHSDEEHFRQNKEAIRVVYPVGPKRLLDLLRAFVPNTIFSETRRLRYSVDTDFNSWIRAVLQAASKQALESGKLRVRHRTLGLDLQSIDGKMRCIQGGFAAMFRRFRSKNVSALTREEWAQMVLRGFEKGLLRGICG
jgi:hypothetical protein